MSINSVSIYLAHSGRGRQPAAASLLSQHTIVSVSAKAPGRASTKVFSRVRTLFEQFDPWHHGQAAVLLCRRVRLLYLEATEGALKPTWETDILRSFADHPNGRATNEEIYETIKKFRDLKPHHLRPLHGHQHAYHNAVRSHISNLCQIGDLKWLEKGSHQITPQGRKRILN